MSLFLKGNVTIPPRPHTIGGLISWGRAVNRALIELRDRKIVGVTAKQKGGTIPKLPFQITASSVLLRAEPGILAGSSIGETELELPADGEWYLEAKCVIDTTTGSITSSNVAWVATPTTNSETDFYSIIGEVIIDGVIIETYQYMYGPLLAFRFGAITSKWALQLY